MLSHFGNQRPHHAAEALTEAQKRALRDVKNSVRNSDLEELSWRRLAMDIKHESLEEAKQQLKQQEHSNLLMKLCEDLHLNKQLQVKH